MELKWVEFAEEHIAKGHDIYIISADYNEYGANLMRYEVGAISEMSQRTTKISVAWFCNDGESPGHIERAKGMAQLIENEHEKQAQKAGAILENCPIAKVNEAF